MTANIHRRPAAGNTPVRLSVRCTTARCSLGLGEKRVDSRKFKVERRTGKSDGKEKDNAETQSTQRSEEEDKGWARCIVPLQEQERAGQATLKRNADGP
jgi:hypothetical protein